jgi:hypothetical protein
MARQTRSNPGESSQQSDDDTIALSSRPLQGTAHTRQSSQRLQEDETLEQQTKRLALAKHEREMEILDIQKKTAELAAAAAAAATAGPEGPLSRTNAVGLYEDSTGEITPQTLSLLVAHPGVPERLITAITKGTFNPLDLYKLRRGQSQFDINGDDQLAMTDKGIKVKRATGTLKDYGDNPKIWQAGFTTYMLIMSSLHGKDFPGLIHALLNFFQEVMMLADIYPWRDQVLHLAIDHHTLVTHQGVTNAKEWAIPSSRRDNYCRSTTSKPTDSESSRKRNNSDSQNNRESYRDQARKTICSKFNSTGCTYRRCIRKHECEKCGSTDHGAAVCKKAG